MLVAVVALAAWGFIAPIVMRWRWTRSERDLKSQLNEAQVIHDNEMTDLKLAYNEESSKLNSEISKYRLENIAHLDRIKSLEKELKKHKPKQGKDGRFVKK